MAISPLNNTAMSGANSIEKQNKDTLTRSQRDAGFSNDNYTHTSDKKAAQKAEQASKNAGLATNPNAKLDQDAFMKLLLEELTHQDPTSPMDSDKMLTQTSQLAALEVQEKTNKTMDMLAEKMEILGQSLGVGLIGAIGSMATMKKDGFLTHDGKSVDLKYNLYFPNELTSSDSNVQITVLNEKDEVVDSFVIDKSYISKGNNNFLWDTRFADGTIRPKGDYRFLAEYVDDKDYITRIPSGYFKVDGVQFDKGKPYLSAGDMKIDFSDIKEFKHL